MSRITCAFGAPDVLQRLGRPGFPKGMVILLVGGAEHERQNIEAQMVKLCYKVTSCETCSQARLHLASNAQGNFDIVLAEVGAAEVLEKPLSLLKLQNIWQHVVRKVMEGHDSPSNRTGLPMIGEDCPCQMESSAPSSRRTFSSSLSAVTAAPLPAEDNVLLDHEASASGSIAKDGSQDVSMSNNSPDSSHTVDGPLVEVSQANEDCKPAKRVKRVQNSEEPFGVHTPTILRAQSAQPIFPSSNATMVVGMVHPSWASSQGAQQAFRGSIPPGCVWGTPLNPPPGWQGMFPNGSGPLLGSAAANCETFARCNSAPVNKITAFGIGFDPSDIAPDLDPALMVNLTDDLFLGDDFLDCGDNFLNSLGSSSVSHVPPEPLFELPPIGLTLRKSESLVNLINQHLGNCQIEQIRA